MIYSKECPDSLESLAGVLADRIAAAPDADWWVALFYAGLGVADGDAAKAVDLADDASESHPDQPVNYTADEWEPDPENPDTAAINKATGEKVSAFVAKAILDALKKQGKGAEHIAKAEAAHKAYSASVNQRNPHSLADRMSVAHDHVAGAGVSVAAEIVHHATLPAGSINQAAQKIGFVHRADLKAITGRKVADWPEGSGDDLATKLASMADWQHNQLKELESRSAEALTVASDHLDDLQDEFDDLQDEFDDLAKDDLIASINEAMDVAEKVVLMAVAEAIKSPEVAGDFVKALVAKMSDEGKNRFTGGLVAKMSDEEKRRLATEWLASLDKK